MDKISLYKSHQHLVSQWHKTLNICGPQDVTAGSNKKAWWSCNVAPDHVWCCAIVDRVRYNTGCPFCNGKKGSSTNNMAKFFPDLVKEWDYDKNDQNPESYPHSSMKKVWWKCRSGHSWEATINNRTDKKQLCPYCVGKRATIQTSVATLYPEVCKEWDDEIDPKTVLPNSHKKVWWKCGEGHRWIATVNNRISSASGCPECFQSGGEKIISLILGEMNVNFSRQYRFSDCKDKRTLPFDFAIHDGILGVIEYHGGQHYFPVSIFGGSKEFDEITRRDSIKQQYCKDKGIPLLTISYSESKHIRKLITEFVRSLSA